MNSETQNNTTHSTHFYPPTCLPEFEQRQKPEGRRRAPHSTNPLVNRLTNLLFYFSILFFIIGFNLSDNMVGNWTQQFMPNLNGKQITDITFLDSLNGYAVATQTSDSSYILKTTNGGDNWQIIYRQLFAMTHVQFFNTNTGYAGGVLI